MTLPLRCWLALVVLMLTGPAWAGLPFRVIVHPDNPSAEISAEELSDLFLKKSSSWPDGSPVEPVDQAATSPLRETFSQAVHGRSTASVVSYLNQQVFSGATKPPLVVADDAEVVAFVRERRGAVGYVTPTLALGDEVKALPLLTAPVRIAHVEPQYTEGARRARLTGEVILEVEVLADGSVGAVAPVKELGLGLTREAVAAVKRWRYQPATRDGEPIAATISVTVKF